MSTRASTCEQVFSGVLASPERWNVDLERLATNEPIGRCFCASLTFRNSTEAVRIERPGLRLLAPDPDQAARQFMAFVERVKRPSSIVLGSDLTRELDPVAAGSGPELPSPGGLSLVTRDRLGLTSYRGALQIVAYNGDA